MCLDDEKRGRINMNDMEEKEIREAIYAADNALAHLDSAKTYLNKASNWGIIDIFGGGLFTNLMKHERMGEAEREIQEAKYALQRFSRELQDVTGYSSIHIDDLITFADFIFDGLLMDIIAQSKISEAKSQCDEAIHKVSVIKAELQSKL